MERKGSSKGNPALQEKVDWRRTTVLALSCEYSISGIFRSLTGDFPGTGNA